MKPSYKATKTEINFDKNFNPCNAFSIDFDKL